MLKREPAAEPNRIAGTITGVFTLTSGETPIEGSRLGSELTGFGAVAKGKLWLSPAMIAALGFTPRKDDAVSFSDRDPIRIYGVVRADPNRRWRCHSPRQPGARQLAPANLVVRVA